jgi:DNA-binding transcriptional ArsR family regulator
VAEDQALVAVARALSRPVCIQLVDELAAGAATVSELAARLRLAQPSVSSHLARLKEAGMVEVQPQGRQRAYRLRGSAPGLALASLRTLAAECQPSLSRSEAATLAVNKDPQLRDARTCYDHLAGVAGVRLLDGLLERGWLEVAESGYRLTPSGAGALARAGVDVEAARAARRAFAIGCLDWTERRPHLGGALGAALLLALLAQRRAELRRGSRSVRLAAGEPQGFLGATGG